MRHAPLLSTTFLNWLPLAALCTGAALTLTFVLQIEMRMAANDPQVQLAEDVARALERGGAPEAVVPAGAVALGESLAPFVLVLDAQRAPLAGNATLDGRVPIPPRGVLDFVATHGEERVTWQPHAGVRLATVVRRVAGERGGFVIAGRSLREVERRKEIVMQDVAVAWALGLGGLLALGFVLEWGRRAAGRLSAAAAGRAGSGPPSRAPGAP